MDTESFLPDRATVREYWPLFVGVAVIVVGHLYYYGYLGNDWRPFSPPLVVAVIVVLVLELGRSAYERFQGADGER